MGVKAIIILRLVMRDQSYQAYFQILGLFWRDNERAAMLALKGLWPRSLDKKLSHLVDLLSLGGRGVPDLGIVKIKFYVVFE